MLAYKLGLPKSSLHDDVDNRSKPLVLVDDCIISGLRAREYMKKEGKGSIIWATLFAPKEICRKSREGHYDFACFSAVEQEDLAPEQCGVAYGDWKAKWEVRLADSSLWGGQPEFVAFSWNEPESSFHNSCTNEIEPGFKLLSADRCLNNAIVMDDETSVEVHEPGPGPYRKSFSAVYSEMMPEKIILADFPDNRDDSDSDFFSPGRYGGRYVEESYREWIHRKSGL